MMRAGHAGSRPAHVPPRDRTPWNSPWRFLYGHGRRQPKSEVTKALTRPRSFRDDLSTKNVARRSTTDGAQEASRNELLCQGPRGRWQVGGGMDVADLGGHGLHPPTAPRSHPALTIRLQ